MTAQKCLATTAVLAFLVSALAAAESGADRELIQDNHFQRGFVLWESKPGKHVRYGELQGLEPNTKPIWGLAQWSSQFPLDSTAITSASKGSKGLMVFSNTAKAVTLGAGNSIQADLSLAVNSAAEYGPRARNASDPWVHLLVEQEFDPPARLADLAAAKLHIEARLLRSRNLHRGDYAPGKHAAQFQIFFTVQNRNRHSPDHGNLLWFGVPIYDNRDRFPKAFKAQDFGGTAKFIFTLGGETYAKASLHDGDWVVISADLLPLMREALEAAWSRGFLKGSKDFADYSIGGMNLGWEVPGTFDVELQVRKLSLKVAQKTLP